jgi:F-type H+-transporting ATPase subunit b
MELDATTFVLEIINFLVLLWLLQRFLFKPARAALAARAQAAAEQAERLRAERAALAAGAAELEAQRQALTAGREAAERELTRTIAQERLQQLTELNGEIRAEREKSRVLQQQEQSRLRVQGDRELKLRAAGFVAGYLGRMASPALEAAILELFLTDLAEQSARAQTALRHGWAEHHDGTPLIQITTAFAAPAELRARIEAQLTVLVGEPTRSEWQLEPELVAGICVHLPDYQLEASLRRGIDAFATAD